MIRAMKSILVSTIKLTFTLGLVLSIAICGFLLWVLSFFPTQSEIRGCFKTEMFQVDLCPASANYVKLKSISKYLRKSVVVTEDSAFYQHRGFDFHELEKSFHKNLEKGKFVRGGSTITQQLAKNLYLSREKTMTRKLKEAIITLQLEKTLSKDEILERYLNVVQFGKDIFGVKQAAQYYFKKNPSELDVVESAFLTMLLPSPEVYSKSFYKKSLTPFAKKRLTKILSQLYSFKRISAYEYESGMDKISWFLTGSTPPPKEVDLLDEELEASTIENELEEPAATESVDPVTIPDDPTE